MKHTQVTQRGFEPFPNASPRNYQPLIRIGRVVKVNQAQKTVDVALMGCEGVLRGVTVLENMASTRSGVSYMPTHQKNSDDDEKPSGHGIRDMYAIVAHVDGVGSLPIVIGFKHPETNQLSFPHEGYENQYLFRHESDRYHRIVGDALNDIPMEEELAYPDGSYWKVFTSSSALTDLEGKNEDNKKTPFKAKKDEAAKGYIFKHTSGTTITVAASGAVTINAVSDINIESATHIKLKAPRIDLNE